MDTGPPNTAPTVANGTITATEDTEFAFSVADFNFSDADGDELSFIYVEADSTGGLLKINGADVTVGTTVTKAQIDAGLFTYVPAAEVSGTSVGSFNVSAHDGTSRLAS